MGGSEYFYMTAKKKVLSVEMDEGDDVIKSIEQAMRDNSIRESSVQSIEGVIKSGIMNTFNGNKYLAIVLDNTSILNASGNFQLGKEELFGGLNVSAKLAKATTGRLASAVAGKGLKVSLLFYKEEPREKKP